MKNFKLIAAAIFFASMTLSARADEPRLFTHIAQNGDTLIKLAKRYLVDQNDWQIFTKFNTIAEPRRLVVGSKIKIPVSAMRVETAAVEIIATQGSVESSAGAVERGSKVKEGDKLSTGDGGFVTIKLADGSTLTVQPKSSVRVETARQFVNSGGVTDTVVRLDSGRVETNVVKQKNPGGRYEIRTPTSNMGVRGTIFRVGADDSGLRGQSEVVDGLVVVTSASPKSAAINATSDATSVAQGLPLRTGFGTFVVAGKAPSPPIALLPAPDVTSLPKQIETPDPKFTFPAVTAALSYRAQIAVDAAFTNLIANASSLTPNMAFVNLPDGALFLRVRGVDVNALEGKDAAHAFSIKARPLPPLLTEPRDNARSSSGRVKLAWLASTEAVAYRVQIAGDATFANPIVDEKVASLFSLSPALTLKPANYFWRAASVNAKGNTGPWSRTAGFVVVTEAPDLNMSSGGGSRSIEIVGSAAASHQVQIARDERFINIASDRVITGNRFELGELPVNAYYIRVRTVVGTEKPNEQPSGTWSVPRLLEIYPLGRSWWLSQPLSPAAAPMPIPR